MADKIINTRLVLRNADLSAWLSSKVELLPGEVALAKRDDGKYEVRIGTGGKTWNDLSTSGFGHTECYLKSSFDDLSAVNDAPHGSIGIVTETIADDKVSKTAYSFNAIDKRWEALDGNYSAENVYFSKDITLAGSYTQVGNITKGSTETKTLDAAGKSVKDVFQNIFTLEQNPTVSHPYWNFSATGGTGEIGTTYTVPGATVTIESVGAYSFEPKATGINVPVNNAVIKRTNTGFEAELSNASVLNGSNKTFSLGSGASGQTYLSGGYTYNYTAEAHHISGVIPKSNLGNDRPALAIQADDWSGHSTASKRSINQTCTATFTGYYPAYYTFTSSPTANPTALTANNGNPTVDGVTYTRDTLNNTYDKTEFVTSSSWYELFYLVPVCKRNSSAWAGKNGNNIDLPVEAKTQATVTFLDGSSALYNVYVVRNAAPASATTCTMTFKA